MPFCLAHASSHSPSQAYGRKTNVWSPATDPSAVAIMPVAALVVTALLSLPWPTRCCPQHAPTLTQALILILTRTRPLAPIRLGPAPAPALARTPPSPHPHPHPEPLLAPRSRWLFRHFVEPKLAWLFTDPPALKPAELRLSQSTWAPPELAPAQREEPTDESRARAALRDRDRRQVYHASLGTAGIVIE